MNIKCRCWPCLHSLSFLLHGLVPSGHIFIDFHCCWFLWWLTKCLHNHCGILGFSHIWLHIGEMLREWGNKSKNLVSIMYSTVISLRPQNNPVLAVMYLHSDTAWQFLLCFFFGGGGCKGGGCSRKSGQGLPDLFGKAKVNPIWSPVWTQYNTNALTKTHSHFSWEAEYWLQISREVIFGNGKLLLWLSESIFYVWMERSLLAKRTVCHFTFPKVSFSDPVLHIQSISYLSYMYSALALLLCQQGGILTSAGKL